MSQEALVEGQIGPIGHFQYLYFSVLILQFVDGIFFRVGGRGIKIQIIWCNNAVSCSALQVGRIGITKNKRC